MLLKTIKCIYLSVGLVSLALGILGIFLPLLPTTPFLLLTAYCFSKSSPRFRHWLMRNRHFGPRIEDWERYGVIRTRVKWLATLLIMISIVITSIYRSDRLVLLGVMYVFLAGVLIFIWTRPSRRPK